MRTLGEVTCLITGAAGGIGSAVADEMLRTTDIAESLRFLLRVSAACVVPEIVFQRLGEAT